MALAKQHGFLFVETSAKIKEKVEKCFQDLALKILEGRDKKRLEEEQNNKPPEQKTRQPSKGEEKEERRPIYEPDRWWSLN
ncbi:hypothetical protein P3X46_004091 [Hevea brasiliensis]|uniref:Uncharacterized protein n=2 Tax=Hevea brasiliensis TaxID=3981 RepID=A0ABQ9MZT1_HEVBR|nr:hypothetical protein P3X46_004091 [Hevea brasiliensis]